MQSTVQSWFRFIPLEQAELTRVKGEWDERFQSLPVDGDISTLPESMRLPWVELPKIAPNRAMPQGGVVHEHSTVLENPPVNPVTGPGRTAADVNYELRIYQAKVRALDSKAIFQADFIFTFIETSSRKI